MRKVSIIDLGVSNVFSTSGLFSKIGYKTEIIKTEEEFDNVDILVIPGVGTFQTAMNFLTKQNLVNKIREFVKQKKPLIGICLGMQLLFEKSNEFGECRGLGLIEGEVVKFSKEKIKTHIGWSQINLNKKNRYIKLDSFNNFDKKYFYFVHSYYPVLKNENLALTYSEFNSEIFCSSILLKNVLALQFHPEKSSINGITLIKDFLNSIAEND